MCYSFTGTCRKYNVFLYVLVLLSLLLDLFYGYWDTLLYGYKRTTMILSTIMFLLLLLVAQVHSMSIAEAYFRLYLYNHNGNYTIYTTDGENTTRYTYPVESELYLKYDGDFTINNHCVNIVYQNGTVTIPLIIQTMFQRQAINMETLWPDQTQISNSVETLQVCYDFTTERTSLKAAVAVLVFLFLASHGSKGWTLIQSFASDLHRSEIARRFSRSRGPVAGSKTSFTTIKKETSIWIPPNSKILFKTPTISRGEKV